MTLRGVVSDAFRHDEKVSRRKKGRGLERGRMPNFELSRAVDATSLDVRSATVRVMDNTGVSAAELRNIGLFGALSDDVLSVLEGMLSVVVPQNGEVIFREGDEANAMYVVLGGEMEVTKSSRNGVDARVAVLGPGDWFGEMSIVDIQPRSATVRAVAPGRLVRISAADLDALYRHDVRSYAIVVLNLARELSRRLRVADGILADLIANVMDSYIAKPRA
jgi:CRP-like cAMP-binding protein